MRQPGIEKPTEHVGTELDRAYLNAPLHLSSFRFEEASKDDLKEKAGDKRREHEKGSHCRIKDKLL